MTHTIRIRPAVILTSLILIAFAFPACGDAAAPERTVASDGDLALGTVGGAADRAVIIYCMGSVDVSAGDSWSRAEIGSFIAAGERIRTGAESSCELQFADKAVVRLGERTEIVVERISARPGAAGRTNVALDVSLGWVFCKVAKLAASEYFQTRTKTAVCGVRGTVFAVRVDGDAETTIAVREGSIYALPAGVDAAGTRLRLAAADAALGDRFDRLKGLAPAVTAGEQAVLAAGFSEAASSAVADFDKNLAAILSHRASAAEDGAALDSLIDSFAAGLQRIVPPRRPLSPEASDELASLEREDFLPAGHSSTATLPAIVKLELSTRPDDADIVFAGGLSGRGRFRGLVTEGDGLDFTFSREGFESATFRVNVTTGMGPVNYELKKTGPSGEPVRAHMDVRTSPLPSASPRPRRTAAPSPSEASPASNDSRNVFDDFNGDALAPGWRWVHESRRNWSLKTKPGYLTINTQAGELRDNDRTGKNLLLRALPEGDFRLDTKLEFRPKENWQQAGLILYIDDDSFIKLDCLYDNEPKVEMASEVGGVFGTTLREFAPASPVVYLRLVRKGDVYLGFYSEDGREYRLLKTYKRDWGTKVNGGFWAVSGAGQYASVPASFDYFSLTYGER